LVVSRGAGDLTKALTLLHGSWRDVVTEITLISQ
jgi:hypothetical protein